MVNPAFVENIVLLAALVAVVDGHVSDQEKNLIFEVGSYELRIPPEEVKKHLDNWMGIFQVEGFVKNRAAAISLARIALQPLADHEKHLAFSICLDVMFQDGQKAPEEDSLIRELQKLVFGGRW
ncbi:TerB family tellurite resistance protein [Dapis sp. BLCC M126]|uniref:TerB family tellurite resistance protein n=1 Tax=Dapis sp. BLCC M126 TaxID=3400189 RepID=UPI003CEA16E5